MRLRYFQLIIKGLFLLIIQQAVYGQSTRTQQILELKRLQFEQKFSSFGDFDSVALLAYARIDDDYFFIDTSGKRIDYPTPGKKHMLSGFQNGFAYYSVEAGNTETFYIIDKKARIINKLNGLDHIRTWGNINRIIAADAGRRHGILDRNGKIVVPFKYYLLDNIDNGLYKAFIGKQLAYKVGIMTDKEQYLIEPKYTNIVFYDKAADYLLAIDSLDLVAVHKGKEYRIKNPHPGIYQEPSRIHVDMENGLVLDKSGSFLEAQKDHYGLYTLHLDTVKAIQSKYDDIEFISEGLLGVRNWLQKEYDSLGRMIKASGTDFRFVTKDNRSVTETIYNSGEKFSEGLSRVAIAKDNRGYYGFINNKGEQVIECIYRNATDFKNGYAKVELDGKYYVIDTKGNRVMEIKRL